MSSLFFTGFQTTFTSMLRIVLVAGFAGFLVRRRIITSQDIDTLSRVTVLVLVPCLTFAILINQLNPDTIPCWWALPLVSAAMNLIGVLFGWILFGGKMAGNRELMAMSGIQNSVYLVLPVGQVLFANQFETFAAYCFLFVMGNIPITWTLGVFLVGREGNRLNLKQLFNLPLMASIAGIALVLLGLNTSIPDLIMEPIELLGSATIPLATFILGATLGEVRMKSLPPWHKLVRVVSAKFILVPLVTAAMVIAFGLKESQPLIASLLMIQSASAPATNIILQARTYGGRTELMGSTMIVCYLVCLLAIPFWLSLVAPI